MTIHPALRGAALALACCLLTACGGPDYRGGPSDGEPYGIVSPGDAVTVWRVDGSPTSSHTFDLKVAPGRRTLQVRVEHPIESDSPTPYEVVDLPLTVAEGHLYLLDRQEEQLPPYEVRVRVVPPR